ncbi:MAG: hypothetical protein VKJ46_13455, partial [Leptolyngbyaceae bacterium]|nr:hypothetical protein [Leptolyngbyaceae bacterium]
MLMDTTSLLIQLLDQLPLPLMLQTSAGQVLTQNRVWHQYVGELQDPDWIRQEAAPWLESTSSMESPSSMVGGS